MDLAAHLDWIDRMERRCMAERVGERDGKIVVRTAAPLAPDWMRVAPGTDAAIWRPWSRETGEL